MWFVAVTFRAYVTLEWHINRILKHWKEDMKLICGIHFNFEKLFRLNRLLNIVVTLLINCSFWNNKFFTTSRNFVDPTTLFFDYRYFQKYAAATDKISMLFCNGLSSSKLYISSILFFQSIIIKESFKKWLDWTWAQQRRFFNGRILQTKRPEFSCGWYVVLKITVAVEYFYKLLTSFTKCTYTGAYSFSVSLFLWILLKFILFFGNFWQGTDNVILIQRFGAWLIFLKRLFYIYDTYLLNINKSKRTHDLRSIRSMLL